MVSGVPGKNGVPVLSPVMVEFRCEEGNAIIHLLLMVAETAVDQRNKHSAATFRPAQVNNHILEHQFHGLASSHNITVKMRTYTN